MPPHLHREGCRAQKEPLIPGLDENSGTSPIPRRANETPHSKLCRYCQNIFDHWPVPDACNWDKFQFLHHGNELELNVCAENDCSLCTQFVLGFDRLSHCARLTHKSIREKGPEKTEGLVSLGIDNSSTNGHYDKGPLQLSLLIPLDASTTSDSDLSYSVDLSLSPKQG
jgi:hypothetical protein